MAYFPYLNSPFLRYTAALFRLMRPTQWTKNLFIFLPLFFSGQLFVSGAVMLKTLTLFLAYSLAASAVYCLNDIRDADADRLHPTKCRKPIAGGLLSPRAGYLLMAACLVLSAALLCTIRPSAALISILVLYVLVNVAYCLRLKRLALLDVMVVALGFVLRIVAGGVVADIWISHWIVLMTFLLALFMAFAKRRDDFVIFEQTGRMVRPAMAGYSLEFLNAALILTSTITIVAYIMYAVSPDVIARFGSEYVYITAVFVLAGVLRYLQLTFVLGRSGSPTQVLLHDRFVQVCMACWILAFVFIVYLSKK